MKVGDKYKAIRTTVRYNYGDIITVSSFSEYHSDSDFYEFNTCFREIRGIYRIPNMTMVSYKREDSLKILLG